MALFQPDRSVVMPLIQLSDYLLGRNREPITGKPGMGFLQYILRCSLNSADSLINARPKEHIRGFCGFTLAILDELSFYLPSIQAKQRLIALFNEALDHRHVSISLILNRCVPALTERRCQLHHASVQLLYGPFQIRKFCILLLSGFYCSLAPQLHSYSSGNTRSKSSNPPASPYSFAITFAKAVRAPDNRASESTVRAWS